MNTHELPMILFTVLSQMSVGAFVALGVVQILAVGRYPRSVIDRLADPALLAIGPTLVLGLIASMFHGRKRALDDNHGNRGMRP